MWIKILPADITREVYFKEIPDDLEHAWQELKRIIHGYPEVIKTQTMVNAFGYDAGSAFPNVVMIINEDGQHSQMPINERATKYYPNEYDIKIRGDAVLTGWKFHAEAPGLGFDIAEMPLKWKVIHDMETVLANKGNEDPELVHAAFDDLLLSVADPDVAKMYTEGSKQLGWQ